MADWPGKHLERRFPVDERRAKDPDLRRTVCRREINVGRQPDQMGKHLPGSDH